MNAPPLQLDGADVLYYVLLNGKHLNTGVVKHFIEAEPMGAVPALAVCQYAGEQDAYLFFCDAKWQVIQDDNYPSVETALAGASEQYKGRGHEDWDKATA